MAFLEIPVRNDLPAYKFQIELEQTLFNMEFTFNAREDRWFMDLSDSTGEPIVRGVKLLTGWPILSRFQDDRMPLGELFMLDTAGEDKHATRDDLGDRVVMVYRESTTE